MTQFFVSDQFCYPIPEPLKKWSVSSGISGRHPPESVVGLLRNWWSICAGLCKKVGNGEIDVVPEQSYYFYGDKVTLTFTPEPGWYFKGWTGFWDNTNFANIMKENPVTVPMTEHSNITAIFEEDLPLYLTIDKIGNGHISVIPDQSYYFYGDNVSLTATPEFGWHLKGWSGYWDGVNYPDPTNGNPKTITMTEHSNITAIFEEGFGLVFTYLPIVLK